MDDIEWGAVHVLWTTFLSGPVQAIFAGHIHADGDAASLNGGSGLDLFYLSANDKITGQQKLETVLNV